MRRRRLHRRSDHRVSSLQLLQIEHRLASSVLPHPEERALRASRRATASSPSHPSRRRFTAPQDEALSHTSALPPAKAEAVVSSLASAGSSISLCALPDGIIGKQFSSAATRQSNSTGRLTLIISLSAPSRSPGLIACRPTQPNASASLTKSGSASE